MKAVRIIGYEQAVYTDVPVPVPASAAVAWVQAMGCRTASVSAAESGLVQGSAWAGAALVPASGSAGAAALGAKSGLFSAFMPGI